MSPFQNPGFDFIFVIDQPIIPREIVCKNKTNCGRTTAHRK